MMEDQLVSRFEDACQPHHDTRGSTGYKSLTFTLPKEVSLFAEGHLELTRFGGRFRYAAFFTECISSNSIGLL